MKPIIGITCCMREAQYSDFVRHAAILPSAYISMVDKAGGVPMIIPSRRRHDQPVGFDRWADSFWGT